MSNTFTAFRVNQTGERSYSREVAEVDHDVLPEGDVLVRVSYSSLNYKDALSVTGNPGVTRNFPHTPGIDAAGEVVESSSDEINVGEQVVVIGFDLGMNTPGGFTAALCIHKLEQFGMEPSGGPVLVSGATGGVGSIAVQLLSQQGYETHAITGKEKQHDFLRELGAAEIHARDEFDDESSRPLLRETWGGVVDTVGGAILFNAVKGLKYGASLAACGLVNSPDIPASVFPFILRHVNLLGIDSVELPIDVKREIWTKLATDWKIGNLERFVEELTLDSLSDAIDRILQGQMVGRGLVTLPT